MVNLSYIEPEVDFIGSEMSENPVFRYLPFSCQNSNSQHSRPQMKSIVFATHNPHKVDEVREMLPEIEVYSLADLHYHLEIPETGATLFENAFIKVKTIYQATARACLADDTGLEVRALRGEPGIYSARYAGPQAHSEENISKLLREMEGVKDRHACFRTVMAFMNEDGQYRYFEGTVEGEILSEPRGTRGFGYDPVFRPYQSDKSFAEMPAVSKNEISHRQQALRGWVQYIQGVLQAS